MSDQIQRMVGFRNVAVHDYTELNLNIVCDIVQEHLSDFIACSQEFLKL